MGVSLIISKESEKRDFPINKNGIIKNKDTVTPVPSSFTVLSQWWIKEQMGHSSPWHLWPASWAAKKAESTTIEIIINNMMTETILLYFFMFKLCIFIFIEKFRTLHIIDWHKIFVNYVILNFFYKKDLKYDIFISRFC